MAEFSATDAALNGFRVVWEKPVAVAYWALLQFAVSLGLQLFMAQSAGPAFTRLFAANFQPNADIATSMELARQVTPAVVVILPAALVLYAVIWAAMNRVVFKPGDPAFGYLRLSSDELRQLGLLALIVAVSIIATVAIAVVASALVLVVAAAGGGASPVMAIPLVNAAALATFVYFGVRFSLASALTFTSQRIDLFGSWRLTRGRFWPLLATYLIAFALNFVVLVLSLAIAVAATAIAGGGMAAVAEIFRPSYNSIAAVLSPGRVAYLVVSALGTALGWPVIMTPPAVIYRALAGRGAGATNRA